ncbi:MAG: M28 family peptidase [Steroidobacteraceae bacterium]|nr:M28 family peptidase [Deltaproteobacteria bacterium]
MRTAANSETSLPLVPDCHIRKKKVMVLAHFDTVADSPGADDNASGG